MKYFENLLDSLYEMADEHGVRWEAAPILSDTRFFEQSGSHTSKAHHYGKYGLLLHTWEVCSLVIQNGRFFNSNRTDSVNISELFISALYHDYGKVWDYSINPITKEYETNTETKHRRMVHHISRSAIEWEKIAARLNADEKFTHRVTHNILSHHGRREWGSPVAPLTREAWILHLCDSLSARADDCDRVDLVTIKQ